VKEMKKYLVTVLGTYKNPTELTPGTVILGGLGGELLRTYQRFFEAKDSNEAKKEAQRIAQYYLSSPSEWEKIDKIERIELYRLVRIKGGD
jgi:hypothetical protein